MSRTPQQPSEQSNPSPKGLHANGGLTLVVLGLACFVVSRAFDGGFARGLFTGATVALMVTGAYVIGMSRRRSGRGQTGPWTGGQWLPSRDAGTDRADQ